MKPKNGLSIPLEAAACHPGLTGEPGLRRLARRRVSRPSVRTPLAWAIWGTANLLLALLSGTPARAQDAKTPYPAMAPIGQYFMADRNAEIALARSSAPDALSREATVLVL